MYKIGTNVLIKIKDEESVGKIVYIFKANKIPKRKKLLKYYGKRVSKPMYNHFCGSFISDRLVIKNIEKGYIILPLKGLGKYFNIKKI